MKLYLITIALIVAAVLLFTLSAKRKSAPTVVQDKGNVADAVERDEADTLLELRRDVLIPARNAPRAPELAQGRWVNSEPLKVESLRGRVVLVDFWTFGCYNCRNTLPSLKRWNETYSERGLVIIGVHSPEFEREKQFENVRREVKSLGIRYPVVTDNDYESWNAYNVQAWPTVFVLDKQGRIRWVHIGEGMYDETESVIKKLLAE
ncbi:MAG TPA: thioredoxin-like domain-containing protein [Pyrinomonadaceae bacterium]